MRASLRRWLVATSMAATAVVANAQTANLAPGFTVRPAASKVVVVQPDVELFSLSAGGVPEPRADWTEGAQKNIRSALTALADRIGTNRSDLDEAALSELGEINDLHGAVANSVFLHHALPHAGRLPTKDGKLDWSLGDAIKPLREKSGADYALFIWVRDSYASAERKAAMVAMALLGVGISGGVQTGYASLVDLRTGQIVWFNGLARASGDLREPGPAQESVEWLLRNFPPLQK